METYKPNIVRSGDVILKSIKNIPHNLKSIYKGEKYTLAFGEQTGHSHLLTAEPTTMFEVLEDEKGQKYLKMLGEGKITHEEHKEVKVMPDFYILGQEREYNYFELQPQRVID